MTNHSGTVAIWFQSPGSQPQLTAQLKDTSLQETDRVSLRIRKTIPYLYCVSKNSIDFLSHNPLAAFTEAQKNMEFGVNGT